MAKVRKAPLHEAADEDVERFMETADPSVLGCRSDAHRFPKPDEIGWVFRVSGGYHIREFACKDCAKVRRTQWWDIMTNRTGVVTRMDYIKTTLTYDKEYLLPPGTGRSRKGQWREAAGRAAVVGKVIRTEAD